MSYLCKFKLVSWPVILWYQIVFYLSSYSVRKIVLYEAKYSRVD